MDQAADGQGTNFDKFLKYLLRHEDQYHSHKFALLPISHADAMVKRIRDKVNATHGRSHLAITAGGNTNDNTKVSTYFSRIPDGGMPICPICNGQHSNADGRCVPYDNAQSY